MNKYIKEAILWILMAVSFVYLAIIWGHLPDRVPTHFGPDCIANDWSTKTSLIFITGVPGIIIYLLMLIIPAIDPKKKIQQMGINYYKLRLVVTLFFSLLMTYCLYLSNVGTMKSPDVLFALIGLIFLAFGYYFPNLKSNYFIGIRTPWTLESEQVWIKTHSMASPLWMAGGMLIAFFSFVLANNRLLIISFFVLLFLMVIIPVGFSYAEFQKEKNKPSRE